MESVREKRSGGSPTDAHQIDQQMEMPITHRLGTIAIRGQETQTTSRAERRKQRVVIDTEERRSGDNEAERHSNLLSKAT